MSQQFDFSKRTFEIMPAFISWSIISTSLLFLFLRPMAFAFFIITFDIYWLIRGIYFSSLLVIANHRLNQEKNKDWLKQCAIGYPQRWGSIYQMVVFPIYKEGLDIIEPSLEALKNSNYPKDRMIVVAAFEERVADSHEKAKALSDKYKNTFGVYLNTFHPDGLPLEIRAKGANATYAAKKAKEVLDERGIKYEDVIISCFDADTCADKEYFGCLLYSFLSEKEPLKCSYQPMPVYNNNIWHAPAFARIIEITSSFCQLMESMRPEKFVTFSSHSMSFKTLVDVDYWPVDKVSDDSLIYWKAYLYYNGDYKVVPLYITVSMDVACGKNLLDTVLVQYKQKRRWAYGIEVFPYMMLGFRKNRLIPLSKKLKKSFQILDGHVMWAIWAVLLTVVGPLSATLGQIIFKKTVIGFNLPRITGVLFSLTNITLLLWVILSLSLLPPKPKDLKFRARIGIITQWLFLPLVVIFMGSTPALDAQTRLAFGKYMEFIYTAKKRK